MSPDPEPRPESATGPETQPVDPEAPFGRLRDGTPRTKPKRTRNRSKAPPAQPAKADAELRSPKELREGITALIARPAIIAAMAPIDQATKAYMLYHARVAAPQSADQIAQAAEESTLIRREVERMLSGSAWSNLLSGLSIAFGPPAVFVFMDRAMAVRMSAGIEEQGKAEAAGAAYAESMIFGDGEPAPTAPTEDYDAEGTAAPDYDAEATATALATLDGEPIEGEVIP